MTQENRSGSSRFAIIATLLAFGLVGGISLLLWAITGRVNQPVRLQTQNGSIEADSRISENVRSRVSFGEESLFPDPSDEKKKGVSAIAQGNYGNAITALNASLDDNPNDPETFIYRNNARIGNDRALTIAVIAPAAENSETSLEILRGVAQAQYDINRYGGIDDVPVKLALVNDENDSELAKEIAQTLVQDPSVLGVVGHYSSDVTLATIPVYEQGGLVTVSPVSTAVDLSGISPYLYRTVPTDSFAAAALAAYMLYYEEDRQAAVFYDSTSDLSSSLKDEFNSFVSAWGGKVVADYDLSSASFDPQSATKAEEDGVDTLMIAASPSSLEQAAKVINQNENRLPVLGGDDLYNRNLLEQVAGNASALVVAVPWHLLSQDSAPEFVSSSRELWQGDVSWRTATAYDAVMSISMGLKGDPSREGLKAALDSTDFSVDSATGPVNFLPSGDRRQVDRLVKVEPGTRSGTGFDFVPFTID
ncbi:MAG: ABC transporter substrate-binding protein [Cyanobacteria bacterium P01_F01_bin.53]